MLGKELLGELANVSRNIVGGMVDSKGNRQMIKLTKFKTFLSLALEEFPQYKDYIENADVQVEEKDKRRKEDSVKEENGKEVNEGVDD